MAPSRSFTLLIYRWYRDLGIVGKIIYPIAFAIIYAISILAVVGGYWLKTDMGYNLISHGGWHAFSRCLAVEVAHTADNNIRP